MRETVGSESRSGDLTVESDLIVGSTNVIDELALKAPLASPTFTGTVEAADIEVSGGVFLGGTAAANELNDYEEGTWTPTYVTTGTALSSVTYGTNQGFYTKIGRVVYFSLAMYTDAVTIGSASGNLEIDGLPFTVANLDGLGNESGLAVGLSTNFGGDNPSAAIVDEATTRIRLFYRTAANSSTLNLLPADLGTTSLDNWVHISGHYIAA